MGKKIAALRRTVMGAVATALRRLPVFPVGMPDKRADAWRLDQRVHQQIIVFFPTMQDSLYQLRQWYQAFSELNRVHPVLVIFKDSRTAAVVREESGLDCLTIATYGQLDAILAKSDVRLALYVNHDPINFEALRFTTMTHVYLGHGDSDKGVSASNQVKAYDYCFVAGQAAVDRIKDHVRAYDADARCRIIGQPQLDGSGLLTLPARTVGAKATVLYAPTWEGSQPSVSYSSVVSHGPSLLRSLLDDGGFRVIYRPHPLTGVVSAAYAQGDAENRGLVTAAEERSGVGHVVDVSGTLAAAVADSDLLISDVSGVALSWLPTGRPLLVTTPEGAQAQIALTRIDGVLPHLRASDAHAAAAMVRDHLQDDPSAVARAGLIAYYMSDVTPGSATSRFVEACGILIA